jgi:predicted dehydrogenase
MTVDVGVIGVGSMGQNHARIYGELRDAHLVGVADADAERASTIAEDVGTAAFTADELLDRVDAVSVAVPTQYHAQVVEQCVDAGVHVLVEKPFVTSQERGVELLKRADDEDVLVQVGHIEQFNPAVTELARIVEDLAPISIEARRLGPPTDDDRTIDENVVHDLMIHDIDIVRSLVPSQVTEVNAVSAAEDQYTNAQMKFADGTVANLTASRVTQRKMRDLSITAENCYIELDYIEQSLQIHRQSRPEYLEDAGNLRYRHEGIIERPMVQSGEPLKFELESFVGSVDQNTLPRVTGHDGLRAVELADAIVDCANGRDCSRTVSGQRAPSEAN